MSFSYNSKLTDRERKIITIIQHNNKKGHIVTLQELEMRSGYNATEIKRIIDDLIERGWIQEQDGEWVVVSKLF